MKGSDNIRVGGKYGLGAPCAGQIYDKVFADMDKDYWMTSSEALEYEMIDRILGK